MDKKSPLSVFIYHELYNMLKSPSYQIGDTVPAELELARQYDVSRPTVHKAVKRLQDEGYLQSRAGHGTIIMKKPQKKHDTHTIGLILPFLNKKGLFPRLAEAIAAQSSAYEFNIMWGGQFQNNSLNAEQLNRMADFYIQQQVDGVFFSPVELSPRCREINHQIVDKLRMQNIPIVIIDSNFVEYPKNNELDVVRIDNLRAGYALAEYFISKGHQRVDFCMLPNTGETVLMRLRGVQCALAAHGIHPEREWVHLLDSDHDEFLNELISSGARNLIGSNDGVAITTMEILKRAGYDVPGDFSVAGFDNSEYSQTVIPSLTSIEQPCDTLATLAIMTMMDRIKHPNGPVREVLSNFRLIERDSTADR